MGFCEFQKDLGRGRSQASDGGESMNNWLQTRQFECPKCGEHYTHDRGYQHELFECPNRVMVSKGVLPVGRKVNDVQD